MTVFEIMDKLHALREKKKQIKMDADGCEDRFYLNDDEWEAIFEALRILEGE
jgi:hypothetical protein